jgi:hypothetical protein
VAWSIFNTSQGGGDSVAARWAVELLKKIGAPLSAGNEQFVYDWEVSEGGGGKYNPLNQGPVPGDPALTSTGPQYGGGAADFVSWEAGLEGAADYLSFSNFQQIKADLVAGHPAEARAALIASPWAGSHYGGGSAFSDSPFPGRVASVLPGTSGGSSLGSSLLHVLVPATDLPGVASDIGSAATSGLTENASSYLTEAGHLAIIVPVVLAGLALLVWGVIKTTGTNVAVEKERDKVNAEVAQLVGAAAAAA